MPRGITKKIIRIKSDISRLLSRFDFMNIRMKMNSREAKNLTATTDREKKKRLTKRRDGEKEEKVRVRDRERETEGERVLKVKFGHLTTMQPSSCIVLHRIFMYSIV